MRGRAAWVPPGKTQMEVGKEGGVRFLKKVCQIWAGRAEYSLETPAGVSGSYKETRRKNMNLTDTGEAGRMPAASGKPRETKADGTHRHTYSHLSQDVPFGWNLRNS